ncbi:MAG TPA: EthD domain-containing protein [Gammaproteobacteria bacterium]|nr:EthD domain-containing protein [Gammaproteobacteria bacterium]
MFRLVHLIRRRPGLSSAAFREAWLSAHGPLVAAHAVSLGIRRYVQTHVLHEDPFGKLLQSTYGTATELYDGLSEFWFEDRELLATRLRSPAGRQAMAALLEDERRFIDHARSPLWFAIEIPQLGPSGHTVARETSSIVKWIAPLSKPVHLTSAQARTHWLINHGPLVREQASVVPMLRYAQLHRFDDPLSEELNAARGGASSACYGHAELWFDRQALNAASGPEVDHAFGLFVEDCKLFIDLPQSHFMVGKEHVLVDEPLVVRPLPRPGLELC